jgi:hypothetical protein
MTKFNLRANCDPQHYAIGIKEVGWFAQRRETALPWPGAGAAC